MSTLPHNALNDLISVVTWNLLIDAVNASVSVLDRKVTSTEVVSSITETAVYSYSVPANTLSTNRALRCTLIGDFLNNTGGNSNLRVKAKYGATTIFDTQNALTSTSTSRREERLEVELRAANATGAQVAWGRWTSGIDATVAGAAASLEFYREGAHNSVAEDSTAAKTFQITVQHSVNSASVSFRELGVTLELV